MFAVCCVLLRSVTVCYGLLHSVMVCGGLFHSVAFCCILLRPVTLGVPGVRSDFLPGCRNAVSLCELSSWPDVITPCYFSMMCWLLLLTLCLRCVILCSAAYFETVPGVACMPSRMNPATWIIDIVSEGRKEGDPEPDAAAPKPKGINFHAHFASSTAGKESEDIIAAAAKPTEVRNTHI